MKIIRIIIAIIITAISVKAKAQEAGYSIDLHSFFDGSSVALRWYPQDIEIYQEGCKNGFIVQRRNKGEVSWSNLQKLKIADQTIFEAKGEKNSKALMVSFVGNLNENLQKLNNDSLEISDEEKELIREYHNDDSKAYLYGMALVACEFDTSLAHMGALYYKDMDFPKGTTCEYRVVISGKENDPKARIISVSTNRADNLPAPPAVKIASENSNNYLEWDISELSKIYGGYFVERSEDGKKFIRLNDAPSVHLYTDDNFENTFTFRDTTPECGKKYLYRIYGVNNFGLESPASPIVSALFECNYNVKVWIDTVWINEKDEAEIKWSVKNPDNQKIKGFNVQRVEKLNIDPKDIKANFITLTPKLLSAKTRSFKDKKTKLTNYYRIIAYGEKENQHAVSNVYFAHQIDSIPPAPPTGLKGSIDSAGIVRIEWKANTEPDIFAYRVFVANDSNDVFVGCSDTFLKTPHFVDTVSLASLTNEIYYKVLALDRNFNQSALSHALKIEKPDTIAPARAVFTQATADTLRGIMLSWENSPSKDLAKVGLYRRISAEGDWILMQEWEANNAATTFTDTTFFGKKRIYYKLVSSDKSGNSTSTESLPVIAKPRHINAISNAVITRGDFNTLEVRWNKQIYRITKYYIYRQVNGSEPVLIMTLPGNERAFKDKNTIKGYRYRYFIMPICDAPAKTISTEEIRL